VIVGVEEGLDDDDGDCDGDVVGDVDGDGLGEAGGENFEVVDGDGECLRVPGDDVLGRGAPPPDGL
jgi:hypothetical protein